ncbi:MAG TPA: hypothetical protein VIM34_01390 [Burkholderiaceae bacterium]
MQVFEAAQSSSKTQVGADLVDRDALAAHALGDPCGQRRVSLQQQTERADGSAACAVTTELDLGDALVVGHARVWNERAPSERAPVVVRGDTVIEQAIELAAIDAGAPLDLGHRGVGGVQLDGSLAGLEA